METNQSQLSLEDLAVIAKEAAIKANDASLSSEMQQKAKLEKQITLTKLVSLLVERIKVEIPKPLHCELEYIYEESLQEVLLYVCQNIEKYDPQRGAMMGWVMFILKRRRINIFHWVNWNGKVQPVVTYKDNDDSEVSILDNLRLPEVESVPSQELIEFLKEDPEGLLSKKLFRNNPKASFQAIALKKCEEEKTWEEIFRELELGNTHGPVYQFYRRCCEEFIPYFKKYLCA